MFTRSPKIDELHFFIDTYCNLSCPDCCMNIPYESRREHYDISYINNAANFFRGIDHLFITGGEPTMHPEFSSIIPKLRGMFKCRIMTLATNGYKVIEYADVLKCFDDILVSHYDHNKEAVEFINKHHIDKRPVGPTLHISNTHRAKNPVPCFRSKGGVAYAYGLLYPCCVVHGPGGVGIPLTRSWRNEILKIALPCGDCCFAEEIDSPTGINWINENNPSLAPRLDELFDDYWMSKGFNITISKQLFIKLDRKKIIVITIESLAPKSIHPIHLTAMLDMDKIGHLFIEEQQIIDWYISLEHINSFRDDLKIKIASDKIFNPAKVNENSCDNRDISVRILNMNFISNSGDK